MTFALNLIATGGWEVEWSRTLMLAWLAVALTLSIVELFQLTSFQLTTERMKGRS